MRVILFSFFAAFVALALGVIAHHTITTERFAFGVASLLVACVSCSGICVLAVRAAKKEPRLWPRLLSGILLLGVAWSYIQIVASDYFPPALKIMHAITCVVLCAWTILVFMSRPKNA